MEKTEQRTPSFEEQLTNLINTYSFDNYSNTPDFIMADYLIKCMIAFNQATNKRLSLSSKKAENSKFTKELASALNSSLEYIRHLEKLYNENDKEPAKFIAYGTDYNPKYFDYYDACQLVNLALDEELISQE